MDKNQIKIYLSIGAFISAIVIGFIACFLPPQGIIDASVLWFVAQLLVFVSGLLGINFNIDSLRQTASTKIDNKDKNNK